MQVSTRLGAEFERVGDADLVRFALGGNDRALRALYERYERQVIRWCRASTRGDPGRTRDLAQEIWARTFYALGTILPERFSAFLAAVARNTCRTRGCQERRRHTIETLVDLEGLDVAGEWSEMGTEQAEREHRNAIVRDVLARVTNPQFRRIAELKYCDPEHTVDQIAKVLEIPRGTVLGTLHRFRAAIRRQLLVALLDDEPWGEP